MSDTKQTAVEWLLDQYTQGNYDPEIGIKALAMEREQIEDAYSDGKSEGSTSAGNFEWGIPHKETSSQQYYTDTYGNK